WRLAIGNIDLKQRAADQIVVDHPKLIRRIDGDPSGAPCFNLFIREESKIPPAGAAVRTDQEIFVHSERDLARAGQAVDVEINQRHGAGFELHGPAPPANDFVLGRTIWTAWGDKTPPAAARSVERQGAVEDAAEAHAAAVNETHALRRISVGI